MFDYRKIRDEVETYCGGFVNDFDIDEVMHELRFIEPEIESIDDVEDINEILDRHDVSGK